MFAALFLLTLVGCEGDPPPERASSHGDGSVGGPEWTTDTVTLAPDGANAPSALITEVQTELQSQVDFERVTIEFESDSGRPGIRAGYAEPPIRECGSGKAIRPAGERWLEVRLYPVQAHTQSGEPTLPGREIPVEGEVLRRIYRTCDFEGVVTFVLALSEDRPFRIVTGANPPRIAVDVRR